MQPPPRTDARWRQRTATNTTARGRGHARSQRRTTTPAAHVRTHLDSRLYESGGKSGLSSLMMASTSREDSVVVPRCTDSRNVTCWSAVAHERHAHNRGRGSQRAERPALRPTCDPRGTTTLLHALGVNQAWRAVRGGTYPLAPPWVSLRRRPSRQRTSTQRLHAPRDHPKPPHA